MKQLDTRLTALEKRVPPSSDLPIAPGVVMGIGRTDEEVQADIDERRRLGYTGPIIILDV